MESYSCRLHPDTAWYFTFCSLPGKLVCKTHVNVIAASGMGKLYGVSPTFLPRFNLNKTSTIEIFEDNCLVKKWNFQKIVTEMVSMTLTCNLSSFSIQEIFRILSNFCNRTFYKNGLLALNKVTKNLIIYACATTNIAMKILPVFILSNFSFHMNRFPYYYFLKKKLTAEQHKKFKRTRLFCFL